MVRKIVAAILVASMATPAAAAQWRVASWGGDRPQRSVFLVDVETLRREGDTVHFWTQTILESPPSDQDWNRSVTYRRGSCADNSTAILQNSFFNAGRQIDTENEPRPAVVHQRDSVMFGVMQAVCGREAWLTEPVGDPEPVVRKAFREAD